MIYQVIVNREPINQYVRGVNRDNALYQAEAWARNETYFDEDLNEDVELYEANDIIGVTSTPLAEEEIDEKLIF